MLALAGLVIGAALCTGCLGDGEQPGGKESATQPPTPDNGGVSGGTRPAGQGLPSRSRSRSGADHRATAGTADIAGDSMGSHRRGPACGRMLRADRGSTRRGRSDPHGGRLDSGPAAILVAAVSLGRAHPPRPSPGRADHRDLCRPDGRCRVSLTPNKLATLSGAASPESAVLSSFSHEWGWALLVIGVALLLLAGLATRRRSTRSAPAQPDTVSRGRRSPKRPSRKA